MTERGGSGEPLRIAVLGATGSIGASALRVIARHPDRFRVTVLTANRSVEALDGLVREHAPACVVVTDEDAFGNRGASRGGASRSAASQSAKTGPSWVSGRQALIDSVARPDVDVVVNGLVGFAGLEPSLAALDAGKRLALANKESLVAGGELMTAALERGGGSLVPIDSEHSAILQCLRDHGREAVSRLVLTASGGPFRGWDRERLARVTPADALRHPTWDMGAKVTVDSATLANKALEVIEAHFLFGFSYDQVEVVVHPQSVIHSLVEFVDGSVMAQLGFPTMEIPILYALTHPGRVSDAELRTFDPVRCPPLTFEAPDHARFPLLKVGYEAGRRGGAAPIVFNAANEVAVSAFLAEELSFQEMMEVVVETVEGSLAHPVRELGDAIEADRAARERSLDLVRGRRGA